MDRLLFHARILLLLFVAGACSSSPDQSSTASLPEGFNGAGTFELEKILTIGEEKGVIFGGIGDVAVSESGRIFVADYENTHIRVFSSEGDSLTTIGREGEGPGEFNFVSQLYMMERGLVAFDRRQDRISIFTASPSYELRSTVSVPRLESSRPSRLMYADAGGFLVGYSEPFGGIEHDGINLGPDRRLARIDTTGEPVRDSLLVVPGFQHLMKQDGSRRMYMSMPFARGPRFAASPDGSIYYGRTDSLRIQKYTPDGKQVDEVHLPYDYVSVTTEEIDSIAAERSETSRKMIQTVDLPDTRPPFDDLVVDDQGRLWIDVTDQPLDETTLWTIVDFDAGEVAETRLPKNVSIKSIRAGRIYAVQTDEYGVDEVAVYQINEPVS